MKKITLYYNKTHTLNQMVGDLKETHTTEITRIFMGLRGPVVEIEIEGGNQKNECKTKIKRRN